MLNNNSNVTTAESQMPVWVVAPELDFTILPSEMGPHTVIIRGDSRPQYNAAATVEAKHEALNVAGRDLDGKIAPKSKPLSNKAAMKRLEKSSARLNSAMSRMLEF